MALKEMRAVSPARYKRMLLEYAERYNINPNLLAISRKPKYCHVRWRIFKELHDMGFGLSAIGRVSLFDHTTVMSGLRRLADITAITTAERATINTAPAQDISPAVGTSGATYLDHATAILEVRVDAIAA